MNAWLETLPLWATIVGPLVAAPLLALLGRLGWSITKRIFTSPLKDGERPKQPTPKPVVKSKFKTHRATGLLKSSVPNTVRDLENAPKYASGGLVERQVGMLAPVGLHGPEAILPITRSSLGCLSFHIPSGGREVTATFDINSSEYRDRIVGAYLNNRILTWEGVPMRIVSVNQSADKYQAEITMREIKE